MAIVAPKTNPAPDLNWSSKNPEIQDAIVERNTQTPD
jgi:hypothetical protein